MVCENPQNAPVDDDRPLGFQVCYGPEYISGALQRWTEQHGIELNYIQPENPQQNAYIERFNRTFRTEVLDRYVFTRLHEVAAWPRTGAIVTTTNAPIAHSAGSRPPPTPWRKLPRQVGTR
ncbi:MAG: transposase [Nevskiaceae bacterium]|nr:MAG: transposase [Nevskiaceae bacterium]TBR72038.1 MAG: transposase [Nevskiaceae bacterium]